MAVVKGRAGKIGQALQLELALVGGHLLDIALGEQGPDVEQWRRQRERGAFVFGPGGAVELRLRELDLPGGSAAQGGGASDERKMVRVRDLVRQAFQPNVVSLL